MSTSPVATGDFDWRISSRCDSGACVGVVRQGDFILVCNTVDPKIAISRFTRQGWNAFVAGIKLGDFDEFV
jgi:hypothetical protein